MESGGQQGQKNPATKESTGNHMILVKTICKIQESDGQKGQKNPASPQKWPKNPSIYTPGAIDDHKKILKCNVYISNSNVPSVGVLHLGENLKFGLIGC